MTTTLAVKSGVWIRTHGAAETLRLGEWAGRNLAAGDVLCMTGEVGSGKTTFTKGLARGFGLKMTVDEVASPTFVLIREYPCRLPLYHVDLYRLESLGKTERGLLDECFDSGGVTALEWGERAGDMLPARRLDVFFEHLGGDKRRVRMLPQGGFPWPKK